MEAERGGLFEECRTLILELDAQGCKMDEEWVMIENNVQGGVALRGRAVAGEVYIDLTETKTLSFLLDLAEFEGVSVVSRSFEGAEFMFVEM